MNGTSHARKKIGLALGGGGARGIAHIGALDVLMKAGLRADMVAGVSAGAIVGAGYCAGLSSDSMVNLASQMGWHRLLRPTIPTLSLFDTTPLEEFVTKETGCQTFEDLKIPLAVVTCDILTGSEIVFQAGPLGPAVRASAAFPGLFAPFEQDDRLLVDGGVVNNLPVSVLLAAGCDYVIAVDLVPPPSEMPRPANVVDLWQMALFLMVRGTQPPPEEVDCLIAPAVGSFSFADFSRRQDLLNLGREGAQVMLPQLRDDLGLAL